MTKYRPTGYEHSSDRQLGQLSKSLSPIMREAQRHFAFDTLRLRVPELKALAEIVVEFAEDIQNDLGLWAAYEAYNVDLFGVPLPFSKKVHPEGIDRERVRHLLWIMYQELKPGLIISPEHQDLEQMAHVVWTFLRAHGSEWPRDSGIAALLESSNRYGWEVKRKLIWLGAQSYFFRTGFQQYLEEVNRGRWDIGVVDDFLCQECTRWSGLGPIDLLAGVLDIAEGDRRELRNWHERHTSYYRLDSVTDTHLDAVNVVCDRSYRICLDTSDIPFEPGQTVSGSLVSWRQAWYWSGEQELWPRGAITDIDALRDSMKRRCSHILCRFWPEYEQQVREHANSFHESALARHGNDLIVYPDGLSLAAAWQRDMQAEWDARSRAEVKDVKRRHGLPKAGPQLDLPEELVEHDGGIGVFLNPEEGAELMTDFDCLVSGLKRNGANLSDAEEDVIHGFIESDAVSPAFVRRVIREYGDASIKRAFCLLSDVPGYWLDYLLRSYKGRFFRKRYPTFSVI